MSEIVVYGIPGSPYYRSALLGLEEKGIAYRLAVIPFGSGRSAENLRLHPFGRIPTLDDGDFRLYETQAILRYVDSLTTSAPLQPHEPKAAARMNQIIGIVDWYFFPQVTVKICAERLMAQQFWGRAANEEVIANALPDARACLNELVRLRGNAQYMTGSAISLADLMLAPQLAFFQATPEGSSLLKGSGLDEWLAHISARPSMQATERERLLQVA